MPSLFDWSATEASNTSIGGYNSNTGMTPANVDNVLRAIASIVRSTFTSALQNFLAGTAALPVANGGTGGTDAATALTAIGALASTYRDLPVTTKTGAFTLANADRAGAYLYTGAAAAATIDPNATTAINTGAVLMVHNNGTGALTLTPGGGVTLKKNGATTSATAILAIGGTATLTKLGTDYWIVNGTGVS